MNLFHICCGGDEEEKKPSSLTTESSEWESDDLEIDKARRNKSRIQNRELHISLLSRFKPRQSDTNQDNKENEGDSGSTVARRQRIYGAALDLSRQFTPPVYKKTPAQVAFLEDVLKESFIFADLQEVEMKKLIDAMQEEKVSQGTKIIQQGDVGDFFYVVQSGNVEFLDGEKIVGNAHEGASFGELALLYDCPRAVSVAAASKQVVLWKVDQNTFRHLLAQQSQDHHQGTKDLVKKIPIFKGLDESTISRIINAMTQVRWEKGARIVQKGEEGNVFYIIQQGNVRVHDIGLGDCDSTRFEDQELLPGAWFGERALLTGEPRAANVTALTDVTTLAMDRETFEKTVGPLQKLMEREMRKRMLTAIPLFADSNISCPEIDQLVDLMHEVSYAKGHKIAEAGKPYEKALWIIRKGQLLVHVQDSDDLFALKSCDYYGARSVVRDEAESTHTAVCEDDLSAWYISRDEIENVVGDISRLGKHRNMTKGQSTMGVFNAIRLRDLKKHRILGRGAFGKVWLVSVEDEKHKHLTNKKPLALKIVSKRKLIDSKQTQGVIREKELLALLRHPFILHMESSFQDEQNLYMVLPVIPGGELFSILHRIENRKRGGGLRNNEAAFYAACIIEGLGHFHQRMIAYRDLKLENVLIDGDGYCVMVDLGFAKVVIDKTFTLVGTPEYLAPEVIMSKGHDKAVDYWSYGVLVFELLVGHSPFFDARSTQIDMFKRIVQGKYTVPHDKINNDAESLIQKLLTRKPTSRLGNLSKGHLDVKNHEWFRHSEIRFKNILNKKTQAPWKPEASDPFDKKNSYFDDYSQDEKEIDTSKRLTKEEQELFKNF